LDELNSGQSDPLRGLDHSVATLAEILEVSAEPATRAGLAKLEQQELDPFGRLLPSSEFWISD